MKPEQSMLARAPGILFFVTGVFWAGVVVTGGGVLLGWAALSCFASGALLVMRATSWVTRPLVAASSLFGVVLTIYQLYVGVSALGGGVSSVGIVSVPLFLIFTVVYLYLIYTVLSEKEA